MGLVASSGVGCSVTHYCVRRAALVPAPAPAMRPMRQAVGYVEANVSSETVAWAKPPRRLEGSNVGLYVPREQISGQLLFSPHRVFTLGLSFEAGFPGGAVPISPGLIQPPTSGIGGSGFHMGFHFQLSPRVTLGWSCDVWNYAIASRVAYYEVPDEHSSCQGLPDSSTWPQKHKSSLLLVGRTQVGIGLDFGWSHLSVGGGVRNQPHNVDESMESHYSSSGISPRISSVPYPFAYLMWEVRLARWAYAGITVYQPLYFDPIIYAPIFGLSLRLTHLARERTEWVSPPPEPAEVAPFVF